MTDNKTGISIRFIRQFDIAKDHGGHREDTFASPADAALFLAMRDTRDIPAAQKLADAFTFIAETPES